MPPNGTLAPAACARLIDAAERIAVFTGAGISTAAGIPDFRGPEGLYATGRYDPEVVFNIEVFPREPEHFYEFTRDLVATLDAIRPTLTHRFFAALEAAGREVAVVTQNIDPLHAEAGSTNVIPVHGSYATSRCLDCGATFTFAALKAMLARAPVPHCDCGGLVKPDVVFFGEAVRGFDRAREAIAGSDLLFVLGSSLTVYPAAALPGLAGGDVVVVNRGPAAIEPGPRIRTVDADLDLYFRAVAAEAGFDTDRLETS